MPCTAIDYCAFIFSSPKKHNLQKYSSNISFTFEISPSKFVRYFDNYACHFHDLNSISGGLIYYRLFHMCNIFLVL